LERFSAAPVKCQKPQHILPKSDRVVGQAHALLSSTEVAPPVLDLIYFLRDHPEVAGLR
jgi:hypothetical protein